MNQTIDNMDGVQHKLHLGNRVYVRVMQDKTIDIRRWHRSCRGMCATNAGIQLTPAIWLKMLELNEQHIRADINRVIGKRHVNKKYALGDGIHASITSPNWLVDVRLWCEGEDGVLRPGWKGIRLNFILWGRLMYYAAGITAAATTEESEQLGGQKS